MKKIIFFLLLCISLAAQAQTFPVNNLTVAGTANFAGLSQFTISPLGPTPTPGDSSTKLATTAFVTSGFIPLATLSGLAPTVSPVFTGVPAAPTAAVGTNSTQLATTGFIANREPCKNIVDYGGDPTGTNDNGAAITATINAGVLGHACVYFPPGTFKFNTFLSYTVPTAVGNSVTFIGAGPEVTNLTFPTTSAGLIINLPTPTTSFHFRDLSMLTGHAGGSVGLTVNQQTVTIPGPANSAFSDVTNVVFRGSDGYVQTDFWSLAVQTNSVSNVNFTNVYVIGAASVGGTGIYVNGTNAANGVVDNFIGCTFNYVNEGIQISTYVQGVTIQQSNFTGVNYGVLVSGPTSGDQLYISGSQFNAAIAGIVTTSPMINTMVMGNLFIVPASATGIWLQFYNSFSLVGNTFNSGGTAHTQTAILIDHINGGIGGVVTANVSNNMLNAVVLTANSLFVNVQSNSYIGNTNNVVNSGGSNVVGGGSP